MQVKCWGVRGSLASGCSTSARYGCNTSCYSIDIPNAPHIALDAGSGLRNFGVHTKNSNKPKTCAIFLSHNHWDHVAGLPFFDPLYNASWDITIYAPEAIGEVGPETFITTLFSSTFFPITWDKLPSTRRIVSLTDGQKIELEGGVTVTTHAASHGAYNSDRLYATAYRIEHKQHSVFYSGDHELGADPTAINTNSSFFQGLAHADIAILDSQYTLESYQNHIGWGHSAIEQWVPFIQEFGVKTFVPTHYDPAHEDIFLDNVCSKLLQQFPFLAGSLRMGYEGLVLHSGHHVSSPYLCAPGTSECENCRFSSEVLEIPDMSSVLDNLLFRARQLAHADAGTIYLVENDELVFSYSHNDTLFTSVQSARQQYLNARLPITPQSVAGYVACQRSVLNIPNVRDLPIDAPYSFNASFDNATGYKTVSICALPIVSPRNKLLAVMQIINCLHEGEVVPFSSQVECSLAELCFVGAQSIEQALTTKDMLLRVLETARLRDPTETGPHVFRVGAMAAELYHHWAEKRHIDPVEITDIKANLRLASMLHDVGKVGIPDDVLKKPGRFTPEERSIMEKHCSIGAEIFKNVSRTLDTLAASIALHHHQRWDGKGYTGTDAPPLAGENIPFEARITSIVDVFDALISPRCYKEPIPIAKALDIIQNDSGTAFDPEMVEAFMEILDTILAIQEKYQEKH